MNDTNLMNDINHMFGLTTVTEEAGCFERRLTDQVDGLVELLARMYCATSPDYVPRKVTDRQRIALYKSLGRHCEARAHAIATDDWHFDDATMAEMEQPLT